MHDKNEKQSLELGFDETNFEDRRLDKRFIKIYEAFQKNPKAILSQVFHNSHQCKAAYRFFNNDKVTHSKIMVSHHKNLIKFLDVHKYKQVLEIQDTTEIDYTNHPKTSGVGILGEEKNKRKGFECHSSLIVTTEGLTLGIGSLRPWCRKEIKRNGKKNIRKIPIEEKESFKWIQAIEDFDTHELIGLERIVVADREADFYEFLDLIKSTNRKMIIRLRWDRKTEEGIMISETLQNATDVGKVTVNLKAKGGIKTCREKQEVMLNVSYANLTIPAPKNIDKSIVNNRSLKLTIIHAGETEKRADEDPLEWYLITNVEVNNTEDAIEVTRWYSFRWLIEEFHKILKAGIKIEDARLSEKERLEKLITFLAVIAVKILWMTRINRLEPEAPLELVFSEEEAKVLMNHAKKKTQEDLATVNDAIRYIANLGGFKGRKSDGDPGLLTLWRGIIRFYDIMDGYQLV